MDEQKTTILDASPPEEIKEPTRNTASFSNFGKNSQTVMEEKTDSSTQAPPASDHKKSGSRPWGLYLAIAVLAVALAVVGYLLFVQKPSPTETSGQIKQMQEVAQQIQGMESEAQEKQDEALALQNQYQQKTGQSLGINPLEMGEKERELLQQKIRDEKDVSVKTLLEEINAKNKELSDLQGKIKELEALLPKPHIVQRGENHFQIAMDFLLNEKQLDKKAAQDLVERTALIEPLIPGFKVWNFYDGAEYGTSVSQGTANVSPNTLIKQAKKKIEDARDEAVSQRDQLASDIKALEERRNELIQQMDALTQEKANLISKVGDLNQQVNSLFYLLDSHDNLVKRKILKGGFLKSTKLKDVSPELFTQSADLRTQTEISFSAADLGMKEIDEIVLYPKIYQEKTDYKVEITEDGASARLIFLIPDKFRSERLVIAVKD